MGEVYRADDLTLDQTVALKFLPAGVATDSDRLAQFHAELRIARQVSHKNVCRLYDLGEHEGRRFLTMEYVDGEDLATLLRRIGRLPQDKAVDIARQLCAGIAAAHEGGVLHRDLKPANVMIDGDGNVRITDFGLAVAAGDVTASRAGTPQYMAPEQLSGGAATVRSDVYALGLVLFEMFTGKRVFEAKTFNELLSLHETRTLTMPSSVVRDLDPAIERVILRCLERDAALRPGSALLVAAALPGGDPLAAALAAGETPSPEMIAAAGEASAFRPAIGLSLFAAVIVGLLAVAVLSDRVLIAARIPLEKSVDSLEDRARDILTRLGYTDKPADTARGFLGLQDYLRYVLRTDPSATRWDGLSNPYVPTFRFWYRTSPRDLEPIAPQWRPGFDDPPMNITNMRLVVTDVAGHLTQFTMVPPQREDTQEASAPPQAPMDWTLFFDAAGLDIKTFKPVPSTWVPNTYADERKAWEGPMPGRRDITLHADAASYRGQPAFFQIAGPWPRTLRQTQDIPQGRGVIRFLLFLIAFALSVGTCVLARRNYRTGRGDHRGATRIATAWIIVMFAAWLLGARFWLEPLTEFGHFIDDFVASQLTNVAILWLVPRPGTLRAPLQRRHPDVVEPPGERPPSRSARRPGHPRGHRCWYLRRDHRLRCRSGAVNAGLSPGGTTRFQHGVAAQHETGDLRAASDAASGAPERDADNARVRPHSDGCQAHVDCDPADDRARHVRVRQSAGCAATLAQHRVRGRRVRGLHRRARELRHAAPDDDVPDELHRVEHRSDRGCQQAVRADGDLADGSRHRDGGIRLLRLARGRTSIRETRRNVDVAQRA